MFKPILYLSLALCSFDSAEGSLFSTLDYLKNPGAPTSEAVRKTADQIVRTYAPRIWWHSKERIGAMDPLEFIENAWTKEHLPEMSDVDMEQLQPRRAYGLEILSVPQERLMREIFRGGKDVMPKDK